MTVLNSNVSIVKNSNIFWSNLQTITITVNCVGVMGKGIALVAKDLVPDMFAYYEKLCEKGKMNLGIPVVYNKNSDQIKSASGQSKKILLFTTK